MGQALKVQNNIGAKPESPLFWVFQKLVDMNLVASLSDQVPS